jgi:hypothetical protein
MAVGLSLNLGMPPEAYRSLGAGPYIGHFDGVDDLITVTDHADFDITDHLSVHVNVQNDDAAITVAHEMILGKWEATGNQREWVLQYTDEEKIRVFLSDDGTNTENWLSDNAYTANESQAIGFTFDGGTLVLYRNGVAIDATASGAIASLNNGSADILVGDFNAATAPEKPWDGLVWNAQIYAGTGAVLSAAQMLSLYQNGGIITDDVNQDLVLWLPIREGVDTTVADHSGNSHDGTITNAVTTAGTGFWDTTL